MIKEKVSLPILILIIAAAMAFGAVFGIIVNGRNTIVEIHDSPSMPAAGPARIINEGGL